MRALLIALVLALSAPVGAGAWGVAGHSVAAEIAQRRLEPAVLQKIKELLGGEVSLASIASWADYVQLLRPETKRWHFVNIPVGAAGYDPSRDCADTPHGDCVIKAIARFRAILADPAMPAPARAEALMFIVHLVADIHQPLHCAERGEDAGGTTLMVDFFGARMSLHTVWDVALIEKRSYDWGEIVRVIERDRLRAEAATLTADERPEDWAWQAHRLAVEVAYALPDDRNLGQDYYEHSFAAAERQLALAGLRLARLLNEALR